MELNFEKKIEDVCDLVVCTYNFLMSTSNYCLWLELPTMLTAK